MFSTRKNTQREKNSERDTENEAFRLNLLVHGSSVPIYTQQPKAFIKKYKSSQKHKEYKRKEFPFPVEKIIYLSERLELLDLTDQKEDSDSKRYFESGNDEAKAQVQDVDFSIDLSSILSIESEESCSVRKADSVTPEVVETPSIKSSVRDSVNVYIKTVNKEKELVRFFRPCRTCNELSCTCDESNTPLESKIESLPCDCGGCCCCCHDFLSSLCGDDCGCRSIESYTSTLASAARSARDLARDLEYVLTALNNESERSRRGDF